MPVVSISNNCSPAGIRLRVNEPSDAVTALTPEPIMETVAPTTGVSVPSLTKSVVSTTLPLNIVMPSLGAGLTVMETASASSATPSLTVNTTSIVPA